MALPASGPLSFSAINTEFALGTAMSAYRGAAYYIGSTPGTFPSTNLSFNNFYSTSPTSPGATYRVMFATNFTGAANITVYEFNSASGFGSTLSNTGTHTPSTALSIALNGNSTAVGIAANGSPYQGVWPYSTSGFGTKYSNPATALPTGAARGITWNSSSGSIVFGCAATPWVQGYAWSNSTGFGSKYANPGTALTSNGNRVTFTISQSYLILPSNTSPYGYAYAWSPGFGTRTSMPLGSPSWATSTQSIEFNPAGDSTAAAGSTSVIFRLNQWSDGSKWGTAFSAPSLPTGMTVGNGTRFSPDGACVALAQTSSNVSLYSDYVSVWPFNSSSGLGTRYAYPATSMGQAATAVRWTPDGNAIMASDSSGATDTGPGAWAWSNSSGFGTKFSAPAATVNIGLRDLVFFTP